MSSAKMKESSSSDDASIDIAGKIQEALDKNLSVLWLVSGGSAVTVAAHTRQLLGRLKPHNHLTVMQVDERFVPIGHTDSNWAALLASGFNTDGIRAYPMLESGKDSESIATAYDTLLKQMLRQADYQIGLFGVGADGHTAGLLPGNPLMEDNQRFVGSFIGSDYVRVTVTPSLVHQLDDVIVFVHGQEKWPAIKSMFQEGSAHEVPARVLTGAKNVTIFTDYKGDST